ncbi:MAG TPA: LysM peptidoglycan-binding domain-containing protein [Anaerolineales bacterium]|nr:LysM peptidoglycan-binding domain-containing protein [Anaerolineales bacterium]
MPITHEEARRLIHFDADQALKMDQKSILHIHLKDCGECRDYANSLANMTAILSSTMEKKWNRPQLPLPMAVLLPKRVSRLTESILMATRIVAVGVMAIALLFSVRQVTGPVEGGLGTVPVSAPPIPTPSIQTTSTQVLLQNCGQILYVVQREDTIEGIAAQFSISKEEIMAANGLDDDALSPGTELRIESCTAQPTGTFHATGTLYTPFTSPTISTPGG